jgi:hypothetical protein
MTAPPTGWTPVRLDWDGDTGTVDWCWTDGYEFAEPAFTQTIERCLREPFRLLFRHRTGPEALDEFAAAHPGLAPSGVIFHMSRCGSTLVTQMLGACASVLAVAEAPSIDGVLRAPAPVEQRAQWLRSMFAALGQRRRPQQRHLVVKLDAWHTREIGLVRRAFPTVPFLFVYRDPVEVMVSHTVQRGAHMIPNALPPAIFDLDAEELGGLSLLEYGARVLAHICTSALEARADPHLQFVHHRDLPTFVRDVVPERWGISVTDEGRAAMTDAAGRHAKNPHLFYEPDSTAKREAASPEVHALVERWLARPYAALEEAAR